MALGTLFHQILSLINVHLFDDFHYANFQMLLTYYSALFSKIEVNLVQLWLHILPSFAGSSG